MGLVRRVTLAAEGIVGHEIVKSFETAQLEGVSYSAPNSACT